MPNSVMRGALLLALLMAAGCGSGQPASGPPSRSDVTSQLTAAFLRYTQCLRQHGLPNLSDPQIDDQGNAHYPPGQFPGRLPESVIDACSPEWSVVHRWRDQLDQIN